jgi:hypothetical protein
VDKEVRYISRGAGYTLFLTEIEAVLTLENVAGRGRNETQARDHLNPQSARIRPQPLRPQASVLRMKLSGASHSSPVTGEREVGVRTNYFIGSDPAKWQTNVARYGRVRYRQVYPGIDMVYNGQRRQLEYAFEVAPGADASRIALEFEGVTGMKVAKGTGELILETAGDEVRLRRPLIYQEVGGKRKGIKGQYVVTGKSRVGIEFGEYDHTQRLVIAPTLSYSTHLKSNSQDYGYGITIDAAGNAYVTGSTRSTVFPKLNQSPASQARSDVFVTKLNPNASGTASILYSAYLGGKEDDAGTSIAVDAAGKVYVTGYTSSTAFPLRNQYQTKPASDRNAFVTKLDTNAAGAASLLYSTYLGGNNTSLGTGIAADAAGNAYVTGSTRSTNFPVLNQYQTDQPGGDAFMTKLDTNASGTASLRYSTYLGGKGDDDAGTGIAVDAAGNAYVAGTTPSADFPVKHQHQTFQGKTDAFVTKLNPNLSGAASLLYGTFLGGGDFDRGYGIAVDSSGFAYVTGSTDSKNMPTLKQSQKDREGTDAFMTKLDTNAPGAAALLYSTYLGGKDYDVGLSLAIDSSGSAYVTGSTRSADFPSRRKYQAVQLHDGAFVTKLNDTDYYYIDGWVMDNYGYGIENADVEVSGSQSGSAYTDYYGYYYIGDLKQGGNYTLTPNADNYTFDPAEQSFNDLQSDEYAEFTGTSTATYSISGYLTDGHRNGIGEVYVEISGPDYRYVYTDYDGYYSFDGIPAGGDYIVFPYSDYYFFSPDYQYFEHLQSDQTADFAGTSTHFYRISGFVTNSNGYGLNNVSVQIYGAVTTTTHTGYDGYYAFDNLPIGGDYGIYPSSDSYNFQPTEQTFNDLSSDQEADFMATTPATYSISGYLTRSDGSGVFQPVRLFGPVSDATYTDYDGYYIFEGLPAGGDYTVEPAYSGFLLFDYEYQYVDNLQSDETVNFQILPASISGSVGVGGATVTLTHSGYDGYYAEPQTVISDSDGSYIFRDVPVPLHFLTVKPTLTNYRFFSPMPTIFLLQGDVTDINFTATPVTYGIIGTVKLGTARLPGVTVKLTSPGQPAFAPQTLTTTSTGAYAFEYLTPGRNYTVTPTKRGYQLTPVSRSISHLSANQTAVDFTVKAYSIAGRITRPHTTTGIGAVTVTLTSPSPAGFAARTVRTDSAGKYNFTTLPAGRNYTIKVLKSGFTFTPATRSFATLSSNIPAGAATSFTGAGP